MPTGGRSLLRCVFAIAFGGLAMPCVAQELEPRRWSHLPVHTNFASGGFAYTEADIGFDPVLRIEDAQLAMYSWAVGYIRTFELLEKTARVDVKQFYQEGKWSGTVDGMPRSVSRNGWSDSVIRFALNLFGAPPLEGKAYAQYRATTDVETIVGAALVVQLPTGEYLDDKLLNLGSNRFTFRPQLGVVHNRGPWSFEATGSAWFYTDNDDFLVDNTLEQDPYYGLQGHVIYSFGPGFWAGASAGYGFGGESTVNGEEKDDRKENLGWALSFGYPIEPWLGVKLSYVGLRTLEDVGSDSDTFTFGLSTFW